MTEAITKNGKKVYLSFVPDCEDNEGGYFVEVYFNEYGDYQDYFCIHTDDCDCKDMDAVEEFAKKYISEEEYDFDDYDDENDVDDDEELAEGDFDTINQIEKLFDKLSSNGKVSVMCSLYYDMYDGEKDKFLRDTENG